MVGPGLDPEKMAKVQAVSGKIDAEVRLDYNENKLILGLTTTDADAAELIPSLISQLGEALATQLSAFFAIQGEIVEVSKKE